MNPLKTSSNSFRLQKKRLAAQTAYLTKRIESLPEGSATVYSVGNRIRMVGSSGGKKIYYSRKDLPLVRDLILKKYLIKKRDELAEAQKLLDHYSRFEQKHLGQAEQYLMENMIRDKVIEYADITEEKLEEAAGE